MGLDLTRRLPRADEASAWLAAGHLETLALGFFALAAPSFAVMISLGLVPLLAAATVVVLLSRLWRGCLALPDWDLSLALALPLAWVFFACLLSPDPVLSLNAAARVALMLWGGLFLVAQVGALEPAQRRPLGPLLVAGFGIALGFLLLEGLDGRFLIGLLFEPTEGSRHPLSMLNRGTTGLALFVWPAALLLWRRGRRWRWAAIALPVGFFALTAVYESMAAIVALAAGLAVAAIAWYRPRLGCGVLLAASVVALLGMPLIATGLERAGLGEANGLPNSTRHRVMIWAYATEQIAAKPLFGWGFDASRFVGDVPIELTPGVVRDAMPLHPHNAGLQILLELGLLGGLLALVLLVALLRRLGGGAGAVAAAQQGCYAAALVIASASFGIWQNRWIAVLVTAAVLLRMAQPNPPAQREGTPDD